MPPTPYGDPMRYEPGAPVPVIVAPAPTRLQVLSTAAASLGASAVSIVSIVVEGPHAGHGDLPLLAVGGLVAAAVIGQRIIPARKEPDPPLAERLADERSRIIKKMRQGEIGAGDARKMLALIDEEQQKLDENP